MCDKFRESPDADTLAFAFLSLHGTRAAGAALHVPTPVSPLLLIVSPLATLAFELCVVGETGLKTGWVRCRHGAGGRGVAGWDTMVQMFLVSPGKSMCVNLPMCV